MITVIIIVCYFANTSQSYNYINYYSGVEMISFSAVAVTETLSAGVRFI